MQVEVTTSDEDARVIYEVPGYPVKVMRDDERSFDERGLMDLLRSMPRQPEVRIEVRVTLADGSVVSEVRRESATLWESYRQYYRGQVIRTVADHVAARLAYDEDNRA